MTAVAELLIGEELGQLFAIAKAWGWSVERKATDRIHLGMRAKDESAFWLLIEIDNYPAQPPAFHWSDATGERLDDPRDTPKGGAFFHGSGRICAPWNRLAYQSVDPKGPHADWQLAAWKSNPYTRGTKTLSAMALRIHHEFQTVFEGRMG